MPRNDVVDIPFDEAANVGEIRYRLAPIDVGFDLRAEKMHVAIARSDDPLRASYGSRKGERRVVSGSQDAVLRHLRRHGYRFHVE